MSYLTKYIDYFKSFTIMENPTESSRQDMEILVKNISNNLTTFTKDPIGMVVSSLMLLLVYFCFATTFIYKGISLFIPSYCIYHVLNSNTNQEVKYKNILTYFFVYSHIEFISDILETVGFGLLHLKIALVVVLLYTVHYRNEWLEMIYNKIVYFDTIGFYTLFFTYSRLIQEYNKFKQTIKIKKNE